jgi:Lon protease-like protein
MSYRMPLFPLQAVVFPGGLLPLRIFEPRYMDMVTQAISAQTPFGICAIREGREVDVDVTHHAVGTRVAVIDWEMPQTGILHIQTQAHERFVIRTTHCEANGLLMGEVDDVSVEAGVAVPDELGFCAEVLQHIITGLGEDNFVQPHDYANAVWVSYRLSEVLPLKLGVRQALLEMNDAVTRLSFLADFINKQSA